MIKSLNALVITVCAMFLAVACANDDYFGQSQWNEIKAFTVPGQSGSTVISKSSSTVTLSVSKGVDRTDLVPNTLEISNFATVSPGKNVARDFTEPVEYEVRAENGSMRVWTVIIDEIGENPQLPNSGFDLWYETSAGITSPIIYEEPGENEDNTVWASANYGLTYFGSQPNTTPVDLGDGNFAAMMETVPAPAVVALAAGTMFTGVFELSISNPSSSAKFGTPYSERPTGFRVNYVYLPGDDLVGVDADECDIYVLLEKRDGESVYFRSPFG